ncbi:MAG: peptidoglycan-binding protein, partial [Candidatus Omnitrophica bacterium]|nr:peptidoglycan-binding protein [Candidatus Omnitrophota bacterium]
MKRIILSILFLFLIGIVLVQPFRNFVQDISQRNKAQKEERQLLGITSFYNPRIQEIQKNLKELGLDPGPLDGIMGSKTRQALAYFQRQNNLWPHGKVDLKTYQELTRQVLEKRKEAKIPAETIPLIQDSSEIKKEIPKDKKRQIQYALKKAGFYKGKIDGKIGPQTRQAIREFQKANNLKVDGIVGEKTWQKLQRYL